MVCEAEGYPRSVDGADRCYFCLSGDCDDLCAMVWWEDFFLEELELVLLIGRFLLLGYGAHSEL